MRLPSPHFMVSIFIIVITALVVTVWLKAYHHTPHKPRTPTYQKPDVQWCLTPAVTDAWKCIKDADYANPRVRYDL